MRNGAVMHHTFKDKGLRDVKNGVSMILDTGKFVFGNQQYLQFYILFIIKDKYKMQNIFLKNTVAVLVQNAQEFIK